MHRGLKTAFTMQLRFPQHREIPSWQQADRAGFLPPPLPSAVQGLGRASRMLTRCWHPSQSPTDHAGCAGEPCVLPLLLAVLTLSSHPHTHVGFPEEHTGPARMQSGLRTAAKAAREQNRQERAQSRLPLTQG